MKVETYEEISLDEQQGDVINELVSEEAIALIESLDLGGQRALVERASAGEEELLTRNPYRLMTLEEQRVFAVLCPLRTPIERYGDGAVPLRVLQVAAHAKPMFKRLEVWHPASAEIKDPVLVGIRQHPERSWQTQEFILARWGSVLEPFEMLRAQAFELLRAKTASALSRAEAEVQGWKANLDDYLRGYLAGGDVREPKVELPLGAGAF